MPDCGGEGYQVRQGGAGSERSALRRQGAGLEQSEEFALKESDSGRFVTPRIYISLVVCSKTLNYKLRAQYQHNELNVRSSRVEALEVDNVEVHAAPLAALQMEEL
jgi:hypothetical protein